MKVQYGEPKNQKDELNRIPSYCFSWNWMTKNGQPRRSGNSWDNKAKAEERWLKYQTEGRNPAPIRIQYFAGYVF